MPKKIWQRSTLYERINEAEGHFHPSMKYDHPILQEGLSSIQEFATLTGDRATALTDALNELKVEGTEDSKYPNVKSTVASVNAALTKVAKPGQIPGEPIDSKNPPIVNVSTLLSAMHKSLEEINEYLSGVNKIMSMDPTDPNNPYTVQQRTNAESFHPDQLKSWLKLDIGQTRETVGELHTAELDAMKAHFTTPEFQNALHADRITNSDKYKEDLIKTLEERQKKEMAAFEALKAEEESLHQESLKPYKKTRAVVLASLSENNRDSINEIVKPKSRAQFRGKNTGKKAYLPVHFENVTEDDLKKLFKKMTTVRGRTLTYENGNLYVSSDTIGAMGTWGLGREDLFQLAANWKALGKDTCTISVTHTSEKSARKLAVWAIEEAQRAGFDLNNIIIKMNGEVLKHENGILTVSRDKGTEQIASYEKIEPRVKYSDQEDIEKGLASKMRDTFHAIRKEHAKVQAQLPNQAPTNQATTPATDPVEAHIGGSMQRRN